MKLKINNVLDNKWEQEMVVLAFAFTLFSIKNDWIIFHSFSAVMHGIVFFSILYLHAQFNRFFFLPILFTNRPWPYFFFTALVIILVTLFLHEVAGWWIFSGASSARLTYLTGFPYQFASVVGTLICVLGPTTFFTFYRDQKKQANEKLLLSQMQLNSLRSQLNPHFLFNTFNTLYGISLEYPERTPDLIMKVSQLMRYQLDNNNKQCVSIDDEIAFIDSYIQLEKERVGYRCNIIYHCDIDNESAYNISPMLLIAFVENAFKHGACAIENCYVNIDIKVKSGTLHLKVVNSIPEKKREVVSTKIGLKNTKERMDIIYGDRYQLDIEERQDIFTVNLAIQLKKTGI